MDCCPVMVSDLPVLCSRIDGVVTVVKAEHPNSRCHDLYWGKSLPVHHALHYQTSLSASRQTDGSLVVILHVMLKWYLVGP